MSSISRWAYKNEAFVKPLLRNREWHGDPEYGEEYKIACSWISSDTKMAYLARSGIPAAELLEYKDIIFTEDARPQQGDLIRLPTSPDWNLIKDRTVWEMEAFNDTPDYRLMT